MRPVHALLFAVALLGGCPYEEPVPETPVCDAKKQNTEIKRIDGPFDADGDLFMDGNNEDCLEAYKGGDLDCDDDDPNIFPGATEVFCDGVDNDCDPDTLDGDDEDGDFDPHCTDCNEDDPTVFTGGPELCDGKDNNCNDEIDEGCTYDFTGEWTLNKTVGYTCNTGFVNYNFSKFDVEHNSDEITIVAGTERPGTMDGKMVNTTAFYTQRVRSGPCDEKYRIEGVFEGDSKMTGVFTVTFTGQCANCKAQTLDIEATRK